MKFSASLILLLVIVTGCTGVPFFSPTAIPRPPATPFPTLPLPSAEPVSLSLVETPGTTPTAVQPAPSPSLTWTPGAAQGQAAAPVLLSSFDLNPLPGEGRAPSALARLNHSVYVANRTTRNLGVIEQGLVRRYIPLDANPSALVADPVHNRIYASSYETPTLYLIEDEKVTKQAVAGGRINSLALDGNDLYVALDSDAIIERYDAATLKKKDSLKLSQGFGVSALVVDSARNRLYAGEYGKIVAVDLAEFKERNVLEAPYLYAGFAVNPADGSIWSGAYDDKASQSYVVGYSAAGQEIAHLVLGSDLEAAAFDQQGRLYVVDRFDNKIHVIQTPDARLVTSIPVNESPQAVLIDDTAQSAYVTNQDDDSVSMIDLATLQVTTTVPLANRITALAANAGGTRVYAVNGANNTLYAVEGDKVIAQAATGNSPVDLALDENAQRLFVANRSDGTLTVFNSTSLEPVASRYITRSLSTVAIDATNHKLFAGGQVLEPSSLEPQATFFAQGLTLNSLSTPRYERANPTLQKLYALASNGVPGSNSRLTLFRFDYRDLANSKLLGSKNGGNTTALAIDPSTNYLYATNTHPLAYTHGLDVFDAGDQLVQTLAQNSATTAMVLSPANHHLFLAHANTYEPYAAVANARDNTVEVLDTRNLGQVASVAVPDLPWRMTLAGDKVYVASYRTGTVSILGDANTTQPPPPTPTRTATPYPTLAPTVARPAATRTSDAPTPVADNVCSDPVPVRFVPFQEKISALGTLSPGCPLELETESDSFAYQALEHGFMLDDFRNPEAKRVYVFFPDGTWKMYPDTFQEGEGDKICPDVPVALSRWRPKRGFGSVWCKELAVQALGPGLEEEHRAEVTLQKFAQGELWSLAQRGVLVLWNDGTWQE